MDYDLSKLTDAQRESIIRGLMILKPSEYTLGWSDRGTIQELKESIGETILDTEGYRTFMQDGKTYHEVLIRIPNSMKRDILSDTSKIRSAVKLKLNLDADQYFFAYLDTTPIEEIIRVGEVFAKHLFDFVSIMKAQLNEPQGHTDRGSE